ncbi:Rpn family recombination-promoting nuclease/putative transposase [Butyrivibrio sp. VCB2006]|uniref:Rpn family recombination-promoting nuclease/putative transposase n=1 Tax=Butyrivibrio sp. VCB2006 TaxID=1280679 RepID=UPI000492E2DC|nr:Rpn family recombination-promoting nuclease/putative transposase [Butyrivibrio sp. VCB2006]
MSNQESKCSEESCKPVSFKTATGRIKFTLRSDLLFHYVMQKSKRALIGLVCALKGISPEDVLSIEVLNPIDLNSYVKETVMDLKLMLNNGEVMNIELQTYNDRHWTDRSILYMCRAFDSIKEGDNYSELKPTRHYCITDQDLFPEHPEFYAEYLLLNTKTHQPYTNNFGINVLQLNHIDLATKSDEENNLVYWAKLFNASTWEEFTALAGDNPDIEEVGTMIFTLNTDNQTAEILEGQRRYREMLATAHADGVKETEERLGAVIAEKDETIKRLTAELEAFKKQNEQ